MASSQLAIIGDYGYLFGGDNITGSKILKFSVSDPFIFIDDGYNLPDSVYGSQLAVVGSKIYLFGGADDGVATNKIFYCFTSNPLVWFTAGSTLPVAIAHSSLVILDSYLYLFGGEDGSTPSDIIMRAPISNPLTWSVVGSLPTHLYGSQPAILNDKLYLFGGIESNYFNPSAIILSANRATPLIWTKEAKSLPQKTAFAQYITIGTFGYLFGGNISGTSIYRCTATDAVTWTNTGKKLPGHTNQSQIAIIDDAIYLFAGNGTTVIYKSGVIKKYNYTYNYNYHTNPLMPQVYNWNKASVKNATDDNDLFRIIGFPYWKTDFKI
jgi:N-acetylneuraminic acid mutarotase